MTYSIQRAYTRSLRYHSHNWSSSGQVA